MLGHVDVVHGTYYVLMWLEVRLAGHSELALRLPSALAMAAAAALITVTGPRLVSGRAGLAAGLTFAALPAVSWFAQDARPFALETAAAAAASYFLVRLAEDGGRGRWACCYAASLVALGLANVFGLLLIPAHAVTVAAWRGQTRGGPGPPVAPGGAHRLRGAPAADGGGLGAAGPGRLAAATGPRPPWPPGAWSARPGCSWPRWC